MQRRMLPSGFIIVIMLETQSVGSCTVVIAPLAVSLSSSCFNLGLIATGTRRGGMTVGLAFSLISRCTSPRMWPCAIKYVSKGCHDLF